MCLSNKPHLTYNTRRVDELKNHRQEWESSQRCKETNVVRTPWLYALFLYVELVLMW